MGDSTSASLERAAPNAQALLATRERVQRDPASATGSFSVATDWSHGTRTIARARSFQMGTDEPVILGGTDEAPDPMELLLAALGSCLTIGWVKQSQLRGIVLRHLRIVVEAPYDLRGYLAMADDVRPGFSKPTYRVEVDSDASSDVLAEIKLAAERTSPMLDNILNATPLTGTIDRIALSPQT